MITNQASGTRIDEVAEGIYRISTPVTVVPGGFSFNQYLIVDEEPLLFHTGPRRLFPLVREAIEAVLPPARLRHIGLSHFEADECGAMNEFLAVAPAAYAALRADRGDGLRGRLRRPQAPRRSSDGESLVLGSHEVRWLDTPHVPHAWECGFLFEERTRTLLCGDLFTQPGAEHAPLTRDDILEPSEAMRGELDYWAHSTGTRATLERLADLQSPDARLHARVRVGGRRRRACCARSPTASSGSARPAVPEPATAR